MAPKKWYFFLMAVFLASVAGKAYAQSVLEDVKLIPFHFGEEGWGYVNQNMEVVIGPKYAVAGFPNAFGVAVVSILDEKGAWKTDAFVTQEGREVLPEHDCTINGNAGPHLHNYSYLREKNSYNLATYEGLIDEQGRFISIQGCTICDVEGQENPHVQFYIGCGQHTSYYKSCGYIRKKDFAFFPVNGDRAEYLWEDLFVYYDSTSRLAGIKNFDGEVIVKAAYSYLTAPVTHTRWPFYKVHLNGTVIANSEDRQKYGCINIKGDTLMPFLYFGVELAANGNYVGKRSHLTNLVYVNTYDVYDPGGHLISSSPDLPRELQPVRPMVLAVDTMLAFVNAKGDTIFPPIGNTIQMLSEKEALVIGPRGQGVMDSMGKVIYKAKYVYIEKTEHNVFLLTLAYGRESNTYGVGFGNSPGKILVRQGLGVQVLSSDRVVFQKRKRGWVVMNSRGKVILVSGQAMIRDYFCAGKSEYFLTDKGWMDANGRKFWKEQ